MENRFSAAAGDRTRPSRRGGTSLGRIVCIFAGNIVNPMRRLNDARYTIAGVFLRCPFPTSSAPATGRRRRRPPLPSLFISFVSLIASVRSRRKFCVIYVSDHVGDKRAARRGAKGVKRPRASHSRFHPSRLFSGPGQEEIRTRNCKHWINANARLKA